MTTLLRELAAKAIMSQESFFLKKLRRVRSSLPSSTVRKKRNKKQSDTPLVEEVVD